MTALPPPVFVFAGVFLNLERAARVEVDQGAVLEADLNPSAGAGADPVAGVDGVAAPERAGGGIPLLGGHAARGHQDSADLLGGAGVQGHEQRAGQQGRKEERAGLWPVLGRSLA